MIDLGRVNLKDPSTSGFLKRWYGYKRPMGIGVIWTDIPEVHVPADFTCVVETFVQDRVYVRAALMLGEAFVKC